MNSVSQELREKVARQARRRCGYCLSSESVVGSPMQIDHIVPQADGGLTIEDNLWLACALCNSHKSDRRVAFDDESESTVRLFDPRHEKWSEHFRWSDESDVIVGTTIIGRATVAALQLNRPTLVAARRLWVSVGWHPPKD